MEMRPRLAFLAGLAGDLAAGVRARLGRPSEGRPPLRGAAATEEQSAEEFKRRLDATRERLKREIPPSADSPN
jgi:hypothetical protein